MIVIIKSKNTRELIVKGLSILFLIVMFSLYYIHMSNKSAEQEAELNSNNLSSSTVSDKENNKIGKVFNKSKSFENTIYSEAVIIVDLLKQTDVQSVKVVKNKLLIICDYDTDIEPVMIRYGVKALVKSTRKNIKIALDIATIIGNRNES